MKWAYLLVYNDACGTQEEIKQFVDQMDAITYWYYCMPHAFFLISTYTAKGITDFMRARFAERKGAYFFVTEIAPDRNGWMPRQVWHMLKDLDNPRLPAK